jgi:hypothetical protein
LLDQYRYHAVLRRTYFLGVMLRLELELPSGLIVRGRMTKEEYSALGLRDDQQVSIQIRQFRMLAHDQSPLTPEVATTYEALPTIGEHI